jgi:hypothetical protein
MIGRQPDSARTAICLPQGPQSRLGLASPSSVQDDYHRTADDQRKPVALRTSGHAAAASTGLSRIAIRHRVAGRHDRASGGECRRGATRRCRETSSSLLYPGRRVATTRCAVRTSAAHDGTSRSRRIGARARIPANARSDGAARSAANDRATGSACHTAGRRRDATDRRRGRAPDGSAATRVAGAASGGHASGQTATRSSCRN